ncbi:MAG: glycoside hydrolase family 28 protein [Candidatus Acidiferrales bacterium]
MFDRRKFLEVAAAGAVIAAVPRFLRTAGRPSKVGATRLVQNAPSQPPAGSFNVRAHGATGNGTTIDSSAINRAIDAASSAGGGTVYFPAGTYASFSIRLKSNVGLYLDQGATILAASVPLDSTTSAGYDAAEPQGAWEPYQDYGHNHWHNSLIWGEGLHDISITGPGLIWGKGLSRGHSDDKTLPDTTKPGVGNKAIALKNCYNVLLRDFSILEGGWFGVLATDVDNFTVDNLTIDTNRDGIDIDCCRNVRVSNCTVNSPVDDAICPKSSYALGYVRSTENITIANCFVTAGYQIGSVLDDTWKPIPDAQRPHATGRIKFGTESNGGFRNITVTGCVFESSRGFALESVDGALLEDVTISNMTMRNCFTSPFFLRLGARLRGPAGAKVGTLKRILITNVTSSGAVQLPSSISGLADFPVEDIKMSDVYLEQVGGGTAEMAQLIPPEREKDYPEPNMFGALPATGFFIRNARNIEMSNVEIATLAPDARPAFTLVDVNGADFFRVRVPRAQGSAQSARAFSLKNVSNFRVFGSQFIPDTSIVNAADKSL